MATMPHIGTEDSSSVSIAKVVVAGAGFVVVGICWGRSLLGWGLLWTEFLFGRDVFSGGLYFCLEECYIGNVFSRERRFIAE